jgi:predicted nucleotidyltransferase
MLDTESFKAGLSDQPPHVAQWLGRFLGELILELGPEVESIVLFGSAAEGRIRATSDVNLLLELRSFDLQRMQSIQREFVAANAAIKLHVMFILSVELPRAVELFSEKFGDILNRRRVLHGRDPFVDLRISREARIARLDQVTLNLILRTRERMLLSGLSTDRVAGILADSVGPIRGIAAGLADLEGRKFAHPKEALSDWVVRLQYQNRYQRLLDSFSRIRESRRIDPALDESPDALLVRLLELLGDLRAAVRQIR